MLLFFWDTHVLGVLMQIILGKSYGWTSTTKGSESQQQCCVWQFSICKEKMENGAWGWVEQTSNSFTSLTWIQKGQK